MPEPELVRQPGGCAEDHRRLAGGLQYGTATQQLRGIEPRRNSRQKSAGKRAVEKTLRGKVQTTFPLRLGIPQTRRDSHFPIAPAATVPSPAPPSRFRTKPRVLTYDWIKNGGRSLNQNLNRAVFRLNQRSRTKSAS